MIVAMNMSEMSEEFDRKYMCLKIHKQGRETLVAVCDFDILGKKFTEGPSAYGGQPDFFGDELASCSEIESALARATMANFVGCKAVEHAISLGYVEKENVLSIDGILYAQMVRM